MRTRCLLPLFGCVALLLAEEPTADPMTRLPVLPVPKPSVALAHGEASIVAPGILTTPTAVVLEGLSLIDNGPVDGLEVVACLEGGKYHEALVRLTTGNGQLVKFAMIRVLGCDDGQPPTEGKGQPGRGTPVRVMLEWADPDHPGQWLTLDASCLVRDRVTDQANPPLPFIYTGSRIVSAVETATNGKPVKRDRFMLDVTKSVSVVYDEPDCLLASPFFGAHIDQRFEANSAVTPPPGTAVRMVVMKAELPLTLVQSADGSLRPEAGAAAPALDDTALQALLGKYYGPTCTPELRAVAVRVADPTTDHAIDVATRLRIVTAAAVAKAWVVPVFTLGPATP